MRRYSDQLLYYACQESNRIEGEPVEGQSFDNHWRATLLCRTAAATQQLLHPRILHQLLFEELPLNHVPATLLLPLEPGDYRPVDVYVAHPHRHVFPPHKQVPALVDTWWTEWCRSWHDGEPDFYSALVRFEFHAWFEAIHPFIDGNGRTGRLLWWNMAMIAGEDIEMILADEADAYFARLVAWRVEHCNKLNMNPFR